MTKIIHVNRHHIAKNKKGSNLPVHTIKGLKPNKVVYATKVEILGPSVLVYEEKPLSCGANVWIETQSELKLTGEKTFEEVKNMEGYYN